MPVSTVNSTTATSQMLANSGATSSSSANANTDPTAAQDRFLTLLVAQLNNQDPMSPMDNAQMTSQMAQINTVTGIQQVNQTLKSLTDQFSSMQVMQGASLVGRDVVVAGTSVGLTNGVAHGAVELASNADSVKVEVVTPGGQVLDTLNLGPQRAGRTSFDWQTTAYANRTDLNFKITATSAGKAVTNVPEVQSTVVSVGTGSTGMTLNLQGQTKPVAYTDIKAIL